MGEWRGKGDAPVLPRPPPRVKPLRLRDMRNGARRERGRYILLFLAISFPNVVLLRRPMPVQVVPLPSLPP